jgi:hypothetical protein
VSAHEAAWLAMLLAAAGWAFLSAVEVDACAFEGAQRAAWGWVVSFATSSLLAALSFAALVQGDGLSQQDDERRMREEVKELEEARLRISEDVMEGKAGALEEDERLRERIVELTRGLMSAKEEQGGGGAE